jgi:hypothetical protein
MSAIPKWITNWLDDLEAEVRYEHEQRLDICRTTPLRRRGRRIKKRPRTAIISRAVAETLKFNGDKG